MSTPLYSIPGATAPSAAAPADRAAAEPDIRASRVFEPAAAQKPA